MLYFKRRGLLYWLYQPYRLFVLLPCVALSTGLIGALTVILTFILKPRLASRLCGVTWARLNSYLTPIRVEVHGRRHIHPRQSYVVVSNHQSQYDILVLYGWLGLDFKWVMKKELRRIPMLGVACEKLGHIFVDRADHQQALLALNAAKKTIVEGTSVMFFPEGTRARNGHMGRFKKGAFKMALDLKIPILPITLMGTRDILPSDSIDVVPGRARMIIHPPVGIDGYDDGNLEDLIGKVRAVIAGAMRDLPTRRPE